MNARSHVLHLLLINFKPDVAEDERRMLVEELRKLHTIDGVLHLGAARAADEKSSHAQALFVYLRDAAALEAYGSHPLHMDYLRRAFRPLVRDFVSLDVAVEEAPPPAYELASCRCASFRPDTYDWQIRSLFERMADEMGAAEGLAVSGGMALNERQHYRAGVVAFWPSESALEKPDGYRCQQSLVDDVWGPILSEEVSVTGPARPLESP